MRWGKEREGMGLPVWDEGHLTVRMLQARLKLLELCKMSKGSKVVAISGQDLSSDSCPLALPYSVSLSLSLL